VLIRMPLKPGQNSADLSKAVMEGLAADDRTATLRRVEFVGPAGRARARENGALALLITSLGIVGYLAMRFDGNSGSRRFIANLHDVVIILGVRAVPVGVLACRCSAAVLAVLRLFRERVGGDRRPGSGKLPEDEKGERHRDHRQRHHPDHIAHDHHPRLHPDDGDSMLVFGGPALHYFALALTIGTVSGSIPRCWSWRRSFAGWASGREDLVKPLKEKKQEAVI